MPEHVPCGQIQSQVELWISRSEMASESENGALPLHLVALTCEPLLVPRYESFLSSLPHLRLLESGPDWVAAQLTSAEERSHDQLTNPNAEAGDVEGSGWPDVGLLFPGEAIEALDGMCEGRDGFSRRCFRFLPTAMRSDSLASLVSSLLQALPNNAVVRLQSHPAAHYQALAARLEEEGFVLSPTGFSHTLISLELSDGGAGGGGVAWGVLVGRDAFHKLLSLQQDEWRSRRAAIPRDATPGAEENGSSVEVEENGSSVEVGGNGSSVEVGDGGDGGRRGMRRMGGQGR